MSLQGGEHPRPAGDAKEILAYYTDPIVTLASLPALSMRGCPIVPEHYDPVVVYDATEASRVLNDRAGFGRSGAIFGGATGTALNQASYGLLAMNGEEHALHRGRMLAFFRERARGALFADVTVRETAAATREWSKSDEVDVAEATRRISFATLCSTTLGITDPADQHRLANQLDLWIECCMAPGNRLRGWYGQVGDAAEDLSRELITAILGMVQHLRHGSGERPLIDWLFDAADHRTISSAALIGQLVTLLTAGWETTSAAMCWTLLLLAHHETAARLLFAELGEFRAPPDVRMLDRLPVLDGVVRESLRLFSPAIGIKRIAAFDQSVADLDVAAGSEVICSQYLLHRDPSAYPHANLFRPDRWINGEARPEPAQYFPFGLGWRRCVGERLALTELKAALVFLLGRYAFAVPDGTCVDYRVRLSFAPKKAVRLRVRPPGDWRASSVASGTWRRLVDIPS